MSARHTVESLFGRAGIELGGNRPWDVHVHDERFFERLLAQGSLGFGDSYVEGWWDCDRVDELICRVLERDLEDEVGTDWRIHVQLLKAKLTNLQRPSRAADVASHYDAGNAFFERVLGPTMVYSCAYWRRAEDLDAAQTAKLELIAQKLDLQPGDHVLELGCGWGSLAAHLARTRGCRVTAVTISEPQATYARERCKGLPVDVVCCDYRDAEVAHRGPYHKLSCVGMLEHIGRKNYASFMQRCADLVVPGGLILLQTIGTAVTTDATDPWIERRIFPGSVLPSPVDLTTSTEGKLLLEDWHAFSADYDRTLMAWHANFTAYDRSGELHRDAPFKRTWSYYLQSFAGCFRTHRTIQLWQLVLSRPGTGTRPGRRGDYLSLR